MTDKQVTVEYYADPLLVKLIAAVDVPEKRKMDTAQTIGKALCRVLGLNSMDAVLIGANGEKIDQIVVYR
ncbi:MAG: hypothetical protein IKN04_09110 [Clostridia bacterium]|nr:hypothetical protein [Clostridia bacterium]